MCTSIWQGKRVLSFGPGSDMLMVPAACGLFSESERLRRIVCIFNDQLVADLLDKSRDSPSNSAALCFLASPGWCANALRRQGAARFLGL